MNRPLVLAALLGGFALYLWMTRKTVEVQVQDPTTIQGVTALHYVVPPIEIVSPYGNVAHDDFNWMGEGDCSGCGGGKTDIIILDSVHTQMPTLPGYSFVPPTGLPAFVKGAPTLVQNSPAPIPPRYVAPVPSFWWGWQGLSRVIFTSDGNTLRTGSSNMQYQIWNGSGYRDGAKYLPALFDPITAIKYNAQIYQLDAGRSTGL